MIWRGVSGIVKVRSKGTGNREQGTGMAAGAWIMKSYMLYRLRPFRMNAVVASMSSLQGFKGFRFSFYRGNVSFVLVESFRARLFLFPVACSLFPLYFPLLIRKQLDKSDFPSLPTLYHTPSRLSNGRVDITNLLQSYCNHNSDLFFLNFILAGDGQEASNSNMHGP